MSFGRGFSGTLFVVFGVVGVAQADLIRVQMEPNAPFSGRAPIEFTGVESSAAAADSVFGSDGANDWNYFTIAPADTTTTNPSFSDFVDSAGNPTDVSISFTGAVTAASDTPLDTNDSDALENEYFLISTNTVDYTISGLPADTEVALYLYSPNFSHSDSGDPTGEPSRAYTLTANGDSILVPSGTGTGNNALAFVTTNSSGDISGTWSTAGNEGDFSGFQIATLPEPASVALLASGLIGLALLRRRAGTSTRKS